MSWTGEAGRQNADSTEHLSLVEAGRGPVCCFIPPKSLGGGWAAARKLSQCPRGGRDTAPCTRPCCLPGPARARRWPGSGCSARGLMGDAASESLNQVAQGCAQRACGTRECRLCRHKALGAPSSTRTGSPRQSKAPTHQLTERPVSWCLRAHAGTEGHPGLHPNDNCASQTRRHKRDCVASKAATGGAGIRYRHSFGCWLLHF